MRESIYKPFWTPTVTDSKKPPLPEGPIEDVLRHVPDTVALELTEYQIAILNEALARRRRAKQHVIDYRGGINWLGRRYYISFFCGRETRDTPSQHKTRPVRRIAIKAGNIAGLYIITVITLFPMVLALYLVKSIIGIDIFEGPSPLHAFFFS